MKLNVKLYFRLAAAFLAAAFLTACVSPQPIVEQAGRPKLTAGYIAVVSSGRGHNYAFGLVNQASKEELTMPLFNTRRLGYDEPDQVNMIEVPPGTYRVDHWLTHYGGERVSKKQLGPAAFLVEVKPGRVSFLGKFEIKESWEITAYHYAVRPRQIAQEDLSALFLGAYPAFSMSIVDPILGAFRH